MTRRALPTGMMAVGVCVLLVVLPVRGQVPTFEGEEVTVPGRRPQQAATTPAYVTVLTREDLQRLGLTTLGDVLRFLAEVSVRTAGAGPGGFQQASIRGSTPQQVLVLIDGVPLNATAQFGVNLATIALEEIERIEVLRGPYSAIYGNALGGVVLVRTRADVRPMLSATAASASTGGAAFRLGRVWSGGRLSLGGQFLTTGGDRPNSDAARWTGTLRLSVGAAGGTLGLTAQHTAGLSGLPGPTFFPTPADRLVDGRTVASLTWSRAGAPHSRQARLWWLSDRLAQQSPGFTSDDRGTAFGGSWQQVTTLPGGRVLTWGLEVERSVFDSTSTFAAFTSAATTAAAYVQYDALVRPRTLIGAGVRYDNQSTYGGQISPRAGFVHFINERVRLRGGVGRAFRAPTFFELAYPGCSNPALRPEEAWAADLGVDVTIGRALQLRVNGFYTDARDLIVGGCAPLNVGSARMAGLSAEAAGRVGDRWTVRGTLTWTDGVDRATGLPLLRVPPWEAGAVLRYALPDGSAASLLVSYVSARDDLDTSTFPATRVTLPGYLTASFRYERRWGSTVLLAGVDNLFDARYETVRGYPATGRTFFVQVGATF